MKNLLMLLAVVLFAGILAVGIAHAATEGGGKKDLTECQDSFKSMDAGGKGYLVMKDFEAMHHEPGKHKGYPVGTTMDKTHFERVDANKDGRVTMEEYCK